MYIIGMGIAIAGYGMDIMGMPIEVGIPGYIGMGIICMPMEVGIHIGIAPMAGMPGIPVIDIGTAVMGPIVGIAVQGEDIHASGTHIPPTGNQS